MATIDCWVTTRNYIAPNETLGLNYGITNNSSYDIKKVQVYLYNTINGTRYYATNYVVDETTISAGSTYYTRRAIYALSLGIDESGKLGSNLYTYMNSLSLGTANSRSVDLKARIIVIFSNNTTADSGEIAINGIAINKRVNPRITSLLFTRCDTSGNKSDTGTKLLSTIKTVFNYPELYSLFKLTLNLSGTSSATSVISDDTRLAQFKNGIVDSTLLIDLFTLTSNGKYLITATLSDGIETFTATCSITNAFANLHLSSASNGGVAIGMFSTSTDANPKFEVNYPTYLKQSVEVDGKLTVDGVLQVNNTVNIGSESANQNMNVYGNILSRDSGSWTYTTTQYASVGTYLNVGTDLEVGGDVTVDGDNEIHGTTKHYGSIINIQGGTTPSVSVSANGEHTFTITYNGYTFKSVPYVACNLYGSSGLGLTSFYISSKTASNFTVVVKNNGSAAHNIAVSWIAYGVFN